MKVAAAVLLFLIVLHPGMAKAEPGFEACMDMFPGEAVPAGSQEHDSDVCKILDGQALYAVRFDRVRQIPDWAAHRLTLAHYEELESLKNRPAFFPEPQIDGNDQAIGDSYKYTAYSRGHVVPAKDMTWDRKAWKETFSLINVVPQKQFFNAGTWLGMEKHVRDMVGKHERTVWALSGVYGTNADIPVLGQNPHTPTVPRCFYKILVAQSDDGGTFKAIAALFAYDDSRKQNKWKAAITPLSRVELRTAIPFLEGLDVEEYYDGDFWDADMPDVPGDCIG